MALARGLIGYAPAVIVPRLLTLAQITLLTRFISPSEFGSFVLVMAVGDALDLLCCNWLRVALSRYGAGKANELAEEATRATVSYLVVTVAITLPLALTFAAFQKSDPLPFFICLACYVTTNGIVRNALAILAIRSFKLPFFIVEALRTSLGFTAVMALAGSGAVTTYVPLAMAMNGASAVAAVVAMVSAHRGMRFRWPATWGGDRLGYLLPIMAGTVIAVALSSSDRIMTERFAGTAALATYAAAATLARQPLEFIFAVVNVRTFPELMEAYERGGPRAGADRLADLISIMAMLAFPAAIGLALVAEPLARTFLTPAYVDTARAVIPIGALAGVCFGFKTFVFDQAFHMAKTIWRNILWSFPVTVGGVILMGIMAAEYGAVGCVLALLLQYMAVLAISIVQASRLIPLHAHVDDLARIGLMCAAMVAAVVVALNVAASWPAAIQLACAIVAGAGAYVGAGLLLKPRPVRDLLPRQTSKPAGAAAS